MAPTTALASVLHNNNGLALDGAIPGVAWKAFNVETSFWSKVFNTIWDEPPNTAFVLFFAVAFRPVNVVAILDIVID